MERLPGMLCGNLVYVLCFVELWLADMVHANFSYTRIARVAGYNNSAQLAGDRRNTSRMLYLGSIKALLHSTTCADCSPLQLNTTTWLTVAHCC